MTLTRTQECAPLRSRTLVIVLQAIVLVANGQADTLMQIQFAPVKQNVIAPAPPTHISTTDSQQGPLASNQLATAVPVLNLMEGTQFSVPTIASNAVDVAGYPASTSIQLMIYRNNVAAAQCSGVMVSPTLALTAAHCLIDPATRTIKGDEIIVATAGKNLINDARIVTKTASVYVMKSYLDKKSTQDIMLVELADPIGDHTGWMGISFVEDTAFINKTVFHKFSFPARSYEPESTPGRRLHYNYGLVDVLGSELLGVNGVSATASAGQSGSPLFYVSEDKPYVVGVAIYSRLYQHQRITKNIMNAFQPIVDESVLNANDIAFTFYPDPFRQSAVVRTRERLSNYSLIITNAKGDIVRTQTGKDSEFIFIDRGSLSPGEYAFRVMDENGKTLRGIFRIID